MKSQGSFGMWVVLVTSLVATIQWSGKAKSFLYTKRHRFASKAFHITITLAYSFYSTKSFYHLEHTFLSLFLSSAETSSYTIHLPQNFKHLNTISFTFTSQTHSFSFKLQIFDKMAEKINVSVLYVYDDEEMQEHFEIHFYRRPVAGGKKFLLRKLHHFPWCTWHFWIPRLGRFLKNLWEHPYRSCSYIL